MNSIYVTFGALEICAAIFMCVLLIGSAIGRQYKEPRDKLLLAMMLSSSVMMVCDAPIWFLHYQPSPANVGLLKYLALIVDVLSFAEAALYAYFLTACVALKAAVTRRFARAMLALCALGAATCVACMFSDAYLWYDEAGVMQYGVLYPYFVLYSFVLLMAETVYPLCYIRSLGAGRAAMLVCFSLIVLLAVPLQMEMETVPILMAFALALTMIYAVTHGEMGLRMAVQKQQLLKAQLENEQARVRVMLSQIQPHFMFNVLNTIYHLCEMDAGRAQQAVGDFSEYLRGSIGALRRSEPVPFETELGNVRSYLSLEKLRFEEELHIVYDIRTTAFMLPMLTVQPLVENAVKHGICKKPGGGTLEIAAYEREQAFEIAVTDDGVGFDPDARAQDDGREHIGISATRQRLREMCGGTLTIVSVPGAGTRAVICIPKEKPKEGWA
ncbi:MAG: sensor histidine kinase [Candidatus Ventricola sp.]